MRSAAARAAVALGLAVAACLALPAASVAEDGGDVVAPGADSIGSLSVGADPALGAAAPSTGAAAATQGAGDAVRSEQEQADVELVTGTPAQLRDRRDVLLGRRARLAAEIGRLEAERERAEVALDDVLDTYAEHLAALFDAGATERSSALSQVRLTADAASRAALVAALDPRDRSVADSLVRAQRVVAAAGAASDAKGAELTALDGSIQAVADAIEGATPGDGSRPGGESVDADLVFATGAIPGIGYWGEASGGGMLTGWMGLASASAGGLGCDPPDPTLQPSGRMQTGVASWYGPGFDRQTAASGETYDQEALTAAHKTLPFGTVVRVLSQTTGRCVFVRINDRGPYIDGRIIDLSHAAATAVGMDGTAPVQVEVYALPGTEAPDPSAPAPPASEPGAADVPASGTVQFTTAP